MTTTANSPSTNFDDKAAAALLVDAYQKITREMAKFIVGDRKSVG